MTIAEDIIQMIREGDLDDDIGRISAAAEVRNAQVNLQQKNRQRGDGRLGGGEVKFRRGQKIRITGQNLRPKYMIGKEFTVKKVNQKTVVVDMPHDSGYGRFSGASDVRIPKKSVTVIA